MTASTATRRAYRAYRATVVAPDHGADPALVAEIGPSLPGRSLAVTNGHTVTCEMDLEHDGLAEAAADAIARTLAAASRVGLVLAPDSVTATEMPRA